MFASLSRPRRSCPCHPRRHRHVTHRDFWWLVTIVIAGPYAPPNFTRPTRATRLDGLLLRCRRGHLLPDRRGPLLPHPLHATRRRSISTPADHGPRRNSVNATPSWPPKSVGKETISEPLGEPRLSADVVQIIPSGSRPAPRHQALQIADFYKRSRPGRASLMKLLEPSSSPFRPVPSVPSSRDVHARVSLISQMESRGSQPQL